jgi:hypothetical protein
MYCIGFPSSNGGIAGAAFRDSVAASHSPDARLQRDSTIAFKSFRFFPALHNRPDRTYWIA